MPPLVIPSAAAGAAVAVGFTRLTLQRALADELGIYTTASVQAASGDGSRYVVSADMRDDTQDFSLFGGAFVYVVDGDQAGVQRRIAESGYEGNLGAFVLTRPFSAVLESGTTVEITSPLPVGRIGGIKGLHDCVNEALVRTRVEVRLALVGDGTYAYSLVGYPWITREEQLAGVYDWQGGQPTTDPSRLSRHAPEVKRDGAGLSLVTGANYASGEDFEVAVHVAGDRLIRDAVADIWSFPTTPGLQADGDRAATPVHWVVAYGMTRACAQLMKMTRMDKKLSAEERREQIREYDRLRTSWARACLRIADEEFPKPIPRKPTPFMLAARTRGPGLNQYSVSGYP